MTGDAHEMTVPEWETAQVARANATTRTPVVFVHGLWLLPSSWDRWAELFEEAGYVAVTAGWPDDPQTVAEANAHPEVFAGKTISEVADDLDIPQHVLRFWETRFAQIKPMKRGGGRRYYRPEDIHLLRGIRHLLYGEGYTISGVQRILREQGAKFVQSVWQPGAPQLACACQLNRPGGFV